MSDDDEGPEDDDGWSNDEMSDSDQPMHEDDTRMRTRTRKSGRGPNRPAAINRVNNFIRLLFKKDFIQVYYIVLKHSHTLFYSSEGHFLSDKTRCAHVLK